MIDLAHIGHEPSGPSLARRAWWHFLSQPSVRPLMNAAWTIEERRCRFLTSAGAFLRGQPPAQQTPFGIFRGDRMTYQDRSLRLEDGTRVAPGMPILVIHFENRVVAGERRGIRFANRALADLAAIAARLEEEPGIRAARIRTILNLERFGFEMRSVRDEPSSLHSWFEQLFSEGFVIRYHPRGVTELYEHYHPIKDYWLSRPMLI
ncbi:MAG: YkoP family protein, partial [Minisyncoccia bacterium]